MKILLIKVASALIFVSLIGCNKKTDLTRSKNDSTLVEYYTLEKFSLPHPHNVIAGENHVLFIRTQPKDTSYVLLIENDIKRKRIRAIYYDVNLNYHRDLFDYLDDSNELLYFEGFSFLIDSVEWKSVIEQASKIKGGYRSKDKESCYDCRQYLISFNNNIAVDDRNVNFGQFAEFEKFLYDQFLKKMFGQKVLLDERLR